VTIPLFDTSVKRTEPVTMRGLSNSWASFFQYSTSMKICS